MGQREKAGGISLKAGFSGGQFWAEEADGEAD